MVWIGVLLPMRNPRRHVDVISGRRRQTGLGSVLEEDELRMSFEHVDTCLGGTMVMTNGPGRGRNDGLAIQISLDPTDLPEIASRRRIPLVCKVSSVRSAACT